MGSQFWESSAPSDSFSVLIVEDDGPTRTMLAKLVGRTGLFTVLESSTAAGARNVIAERSVDLVLLDMGLPDANGLDLLEIWQQRLTSDEFVVIVVSGLDDEQRMIESLRLGAHDYLLKPIRPQILMAKVQNAARFHVANRAARQLSQHLSAVVDSVPDGLLVMDASGRIIWCNDHLESMFGRRGGTSTGLDAATLIAPSTTSFKEDDRQIRPSGGVLLEDLGRRRRLVGHHADGHTFPVDLMAAGLLGNEGRFVTIIRDMSESERVAELERNFVSIVSHELRTPLTSVSGSLSLLAATEANRLSESGGRMLDIARRNVDRLNRLIGDILDLEKLASGKLSVDLKPEPLLPLLHDTVEMESAGSQAKHIRIRQVIGRALDDNTYVLVDGDRFRQIVANFLSNAMKFSPEGGEITVCAEALDDGHVRISVTDHGPGIPESFRHRVFQPFSQAEHPSNRRKGGTGLGLSIVKALAECMNGEVGFDSTPGEGSTFFVILLCQRGLAGTGEGAA